MDHYLHCQQGTSDKVYSINTRELSDGTWVVLAWNGRWGSAMIQQFATFPTRAQAEAEAQSRYKQKTQKRGYRDARAGTVWPRGNSLIDATTPLDAAFVRRVMSQDINWLKGAPDPYVAGVRVGATAPPPRAKAKPTQARASNLPAIPAWILAAFTEIPQAVHDRAVIILSDAFPAEAPLITAGADHPEVRPVDWMRAIFARLALEQRKNLYRRFSIVLHPDQGGDDALMARWNESYRRFAAP